MNYGTFLRWALSHLSLLGDLLPLITALATGTFAERWEALKKIGDLLVPVAETFPTVSTATVADEVELEANLVTALNDQPHAAGIDFSKWDGHRLKAIWAVLGPLLPLLIQLIPK